MWDLVDAPSVEDRAELLREAAEFIRRRRLETPAVLFLEMHRPLAGLAGLGMPLAQPYLLALFGWKRGVALARLLADPAALDELLALIETPPREHGEQS
jgi:hypothetical protein